MRTIRFRAWDVKKKEYSREYIAIGQGGEPYRNVANFCSDEVYECEEEDYIIEQFTGLTDKNGVEIYES